MGQMRLQVGKSYWNRMGKVRKITDQGDHGRYGYIDTDARTYRPDGRYAGGNFLHPYDLIEEIKPESKRRKASWKPRGRVKQYKTHNPITTSELNRAIGYTTYPDTPEHLGRNLQKALKARLSTWAPC